MQKLTAQVQAPMNMDGLYSVILHPYMGSGLAGLGVINTTTNRQLRLLQSCLLRNDGKKNPHYN